MITDSKAKLRNKQWAEMLSKYNQLPLWDTGAPKFDVQKGQAAPSITFFRSDDKNAESCVLIMAGGAYKYKSVYESDNIAKKINESGRHAAILDYRLIPYDRDDILKDAKRAVRYLRYNCESFGFDPQKISVMGFSAGGNLAFRTAFCADDGDAGNSDPIERLSSRPNAVILGYPAVNLVDEYDDLNGEFSLLSYFDFKIDREVSFPPAFIWHSFGDKLIKHTKSYELAKAVMALDAPVELHFFPYGEHGQSLADTEKGEVLKGDNKLTSCWFSLCIRWLDFYGF
ncbi:MAG: alpha/beta hydrolase [Oscillospiraceae bacterium]|jgi:acetyl esterase/lipase|nr:alpha/beta hydrolase [Oscillospiraceae bacterium]